MESLESEHARMVQALMDFAEGRWGERWMSRPARKFFVHPPGPNETALFMCWALFDWRPDGRSIAERCATTKFSRVQRRWLSAIQASATSICRVTQVEPGRFVTMVDLFTGAKCPVLERSGSTWVREGDHLLARVAQWGDGYRLAALHPQSLGEEAADLVVTLFKSELGEPDLKRYSLTLARCWQRLVHKAWEELGPPRALA